MTQEEKAKAYDEALKRAKEIKEKMMYSHLSTESCKAVSEYIDTIIPELTESEDEKIRKVLLKMAKVPRKEIYEHEGITKEQAITYLEKQKEQDVLPGFDSMTPEEKMNHPLYLEGFDAGREVGKVVAEQKPAEWDKLQEDFRNINEAFEDGKKEVIEHPEKYGLQKPAEYCDDVVEEAEEYTSKVDCGEYGVAVTEAYIAGVLSERNRKPAEWSEEDDRIRQKLIHFISSPNVEGFMLASDERMFVSWLKSLRPMPKVAVADGQLWKPSEEQMLAFEDAMTYIPEFYKPKSNLASLLRDLKKLI